MRIVCQADDSHEMPRLNCCEKNKMLFATNFAGRFTGMINYLVEYIMLTSQ